MPSNVVAYEWPLNSSIHIAYETGDNHIHEMARRENGAWRDSDISSMSGAPELDIAGVFQRSRDHGLRHIPEIAQSWAPRLGLSSRLISDYLTKRRCR